MKMNEFRNAWFVLYLCLFLTGCKSCDDRNKVTPCKDCSINEECFDGNCICKPEAERYNGICIPKSIKDSGVNSGYSMFLPSNTSCFTFDSTGIFFANIYLNSLSDTSTPAVISEGLLFINKYYNFRIANGIFYYHKDQIEIQNAIFFRDQKGLGFRFTLGSFSGPPTFRPLTQFGDTIYWTKWEGRFSDDMSNLSAKVVLLLDRDRDRYKIAETPIDSCLFKYVLW